MNTASSSRLRLEAVLRTTSTRPGAVVTTEATRGAPRGIEPTTTTTTPATPSPSPSPSPSRPPSPSPSIPTPSSISSNDEERRSADGDARLRAPSASVKIDWAEMATTSPALQEMLQIIGRRQQQQAEDGEEPAELEQDEQEEEEEEDPDAEAEAEEEQQEEQERQREQQREQDRPSLVEPGPPPDQEERPVETEQQPQEQRREQRQQQPLQEQPQPQPQRIPPFEDQFRAHCHQLQTQLQTHPPHPPPPQHPQHNQHNQHHQHHQHHQYNQRHQLSTQPQLQPQSHLQAQPHHFHQQYQVALGQPQEVLPPNNPLSEATRRDQFYEILGALDTARATPKEFIHLLVHAAVRDQEIAQALYQLDYNRRNSPHAWRPPPHVVSRVSFENPIEQRDHGPPPPPTSENPRKRKHDDPPSPTANKNPKLVLNGQTWTDSLSTPKGPRLLIPLPAHNSSPQPPATRRYQITPTPIVSTPAAAAATPASDDGANSNVIKPLEGEPKENPCNFTWQLDRSETHLGFTGNYDNMSEQRQLSVGYEVALRLQGILRKLDGHMDKHLIFPNRVHILTVMREIIAATLEADHVVGKECRECAREFDSIYLSAVHKLTPQQLTALKALEDGKWLQELQDLVTEANRQAMFPLLNRALDYIQSAV